MNNTVVNCIRKYSGQLYASGYTSVKVVVSKKEIKLLTRNVLPFVHLSNIMQLSSLLILTRNV